MIEIEKKRSPCPLANSLDILGDKWTLLIIRDLMFTNRREFGHFLHAGEGISTNILSERLERLQCHGLINKAAHPQHGKKFIYTLTNKGIRLAETIIEFTLWGSSEINNTFVPPKVLDMMKNNRPKLLKLIKSGVPVIKIDSRSL